MKIRKAGKAHQVREPSAQRRLPSRLPAGIAAVLSLLVSSEFGPGLQGLYLIGLVSHQLGAPLFCLALGALLRVPSDARRR